MELQGHLQVTIFLSITIIIIITISVGWLVWERFACNVDCSNDPDNCIRLERERERESVLIIVIIIIIIAKSERLFREMADHLAMDGFIELGYEYINIDVSGGIITNIVIIIIIIIDRIVGHQKSVIHKGVYKLIQYVFQMVSRRLLIMLVNILTL